MFKRKRTRKSIGVPDNSKTTSLNSETEKNPVNNSISENVAIQLNNEVDLEILSSTMPPTYINFPLFIPENNTASTGNTTVTTNTTSTNKVSKFNASKEFLHKLNPTRWGRWSHSTAATPNPTGTVTSNITTKDLSTLKKSSNANKEKIKDWIKEQALSFDKLYFDKSLPCQLNNASSSILSELTDAMNLLNKNSLKSLGIIKKILLESDLSSFELIHSGLVKNLLSFFASSELSESTRNENIRHFLHVFVNAPLSDHIETITDSFHPEPFSILVNKLNACVSQLEQFPLRVHDNSSSTSRGSNMIKFIGSQLIKVHLTRHPSCTNLKKYKGPTIKLDPFTTAQSIERFLISRGYGRIKDADDDPSDGDLSDDDIIDNLSINQPPSQANKRQRLQLLIGDHVLQYNMAIYQAIKQFVSPDHESVDNDLDHHFDPSKFWSSTFHIQYRLPVEQPNVSISQSTTPNSAGRAPSRKTKSKSSSKKKDELWTDGKCVSPVSPLEQYLKPSIGGTIADQSLDVLCLLRVLYGINRHWGHLYGLPHAFQPIIDIKQFINSKLTIKANRQLQDPLVIITGTFPVWLSELSYSCPFVFPFDTRYILFHVICFDRERALARLLEISPELTGDLRDRSMIPRLEKRKRVVSRYDIYKSAETLFNDLGSSRSLLEIQYENEVGTGLGPTLEFYSLVSKEFQKEEHEIWRTETMLTDVDSKFVRSRNGLFPSPIGRNVKLSNVNKIKQRFKLLGKFMAKALMDSRMV